MIDKGSVKKILLTLLFVSLANLAVAALPYNLSKDRDYFKYELDGFTYMLHPTLRAEGTDATLFTVKTINKYFLRLEKMLPDTVRLFKKENFKIFLLDDKNLFGGLELVREGQSKWDKRHSAFTEKSIIIARAYKYSADDSLFPFVLHEMAHFHHKKVIGFKFNYLLRPALEKAKRSKNYRNAYAVESNLYEYFAEISTAYLLKDAYDFAPAGSQWLFKFDRGGYDLCVKIWGKPLAAYIENTENAEEIPLTPSPHSLGQPTHTGQPRLPIIPSDFPDPSELLEEKPFKIHKTKLAAEGENVRLEPLNEGKGAIKKKDLLEGGYWDLPRGWSNNRKPTRRETITSGKYLKAIDQMNEGDREMYMRNPLKARASYRLALNTLTDVQENYPKFNPIVIRNLAERARNNIDDLKK